MNKDSYIVVIKKTLINRISQVGSRQNKPSVGLTDSLQTVLDIHGKKNQRETIRDL
jgi:hypothetical protein